MRFGCKEGYQRFFKGKVSSYNKSRSQCCLWSSGQRETKKENDLNELPRKALRYSNLLVHVENVKLDEPIFTSQIRLRSLNPFLGNMNYFASKVNV